MKNAVLLFAVTLLTLAAQASSSAVEKTEGFEACTLAVYNQILTPQQARLNALAASKKFPQLYSIKKASEALAALICQK